MKNLKWKALLIGLIISYSAQSQFSFGVSPGLSLNTAQFGYVFGERFMPYLGLQYFNGNLETNNTSLSYNPNTGQYDEIENNSEVSVGLIVPTIGLKFFAFESDDLKGYLNANLSKPFLFGNAEFNGQGSPAFEEGLDALSFWGGEFGFGTEYYFSDNFSLGGEFGLRWIRINYDRTSEVIVNDPNTGAPQARETTSDMALNFSPTYARICLNYYFK